MKKYSPFHEDPFYEEKIKKKEYHKEMARLEAKRDFEEGRNSYPNYNYHTSGFDDFKDSPIVRYGVPFLAFMYGLIFKKWWLIFLAILWFLIFNFQTILNLMEFSQKVKEKLKKK